MTQTMFERYGGFAAVSKLVMVFYDRMLDSDVTGPYFEGIDMRRQIDHQTKFVSQLMGGPAAYTDSMLRQVHARKQITDEAFEEMIALLTETMEDFGMDDEDIDEVISQMERRRNLIVNEAGSHAAEDAGETE